MLPLIDTLIGLGVVVMLWRIVGELSSLKATTAFIRETMEDVLSRIHALEKDKMLRDAERKADDRRRSDPR